MTGVDTEEILRDEIRTLRTVLTREAAEHGWDRGKVSAEFCRMATVDGVQYLYVHCEQAWGETDDEFETRYDRVRKREAARLRIKRVKSRE